MVQLDCSRVLLYGPPLAGKGTILQRVAEEFGSRLASVRCTSVAADSGSPSISHVGMTTRIRRRRVECELVTFSGGIFGDEPWRRELGRASAVIVVLDGLRSRIVVNRTFLTALEELHPLARGCVAITKQDLARVDVHSADELHEGIVRDSMCGDWPVVEAGAHDSLLVSRLLQALGVA